MYNGCTFVQCTRTCTAVHVRVSYEPSTRNVEFCLPAESTTVAVLFLQKVVTRLQKQTTARDAHMLSAFNFGNARANIYRLAPHEALSSVTSALVRASLPARRLCAFLTNTATTTTGHLQLAREPNSPREPFAKHTFHTAGGRLVRDSYRTIFAIFSRPLL